MMKKKRKKIYRLYDKKVSYSEYKRGIKSYEAEIRKKYGISAYKTKSQVNKLFKEGKVKDVKMFTKAQDKVRAKILKGNYDSYKARVFRKSYNKALQDGEYPEDFRNEVKKKLSRLSPSELSKYADRLPELKIFYTDKDTNVMDYNIQELARELVIPKYMSEEDLKEYLKHKKGHR